jgi:hypothetical protein
MMRRQFGYKPPMRALRCQDLLSGRAALSCGVSSFGMSALWILSRRLLA